MTRTLPRRIRASLIAAAAVTLTLNAPSAQAQKSDRAKALGDRVMCMCGGCSDAAGKCTHSGGAFAGPCDTAKGELKEIDDRITQGQSDDLILSEFVQEYGPTVLLSPPAKGFDLWAWIMPVVVPLFGLLVVWMIVSRWRRRVTLAGGPEVSVDLLSRARNEMRDNEDE
ncbi:MAG TPA: cytochrome c-type biogenesis protein CcmH [Candidatus Acidoferrales bacterium]|nr:cytochrome c-type biogenesis protein CcmH [Candidatus Acidoferrales bacterium]